MCSSAFLYEPPREAQLGPATVWEVQIIHVLPLCVEIMDGVPTPAFEDNDCIYLVVLASDVPDWRGMVGSTRRLHWPGYFTDGCLTSADVIDMPDRPEAYVRFRLGVTEVGLN